MKNVHRGNTIIEIKAIIKGAKSLLIPTVSRIIPYI